MTTIKKTLLMIFGAFACCVIPISSRAASTEKILHSFSGCGIYYCTKGDRDGLDPTSPLVADSAGNLYGTTEYGGDFAYGTGCYPWTCGTVFELTPTATGWKKTTIYDFHGAKAVNGADGSYTTSGLLIASGALYGTTYQGGSGSRCAGGCGTVYRLTPPARGQTLWNETVLYDFKGLLDGAAPYSSLIADQTGALYGTYVGVDGCMAGGCDEGGVFKLTPPSPGKTAWSERVISSIRYGAVLPTVVGPLVADTKGNLYGNAGSDGWVNYGASVFELSPQNLAKTAWKTTILHNFTTTGVEGYNPAGGLVIDRKGNLYTTTAVGANAGCVYQEGCGSIFELSPSATKGAAWKMSVIHTFTGGADGGNSKAGLAIDSCGNLYGTTASGGSYVNAGYGSGVVFEVTAAKRFETLYAFKGYCCTSIYGHDVYDGQSPYAAPLLSNGALFGTTTAGGTHNDGAVFELRP